MDHWIKGWLTWIEKKMARQLDSVVSWIDGWIDKRIDKWLAG